MAVINTNITSMIAQQNLTESKSGLTTAMERLSSGLRINSAADDAAGQAIANRMTSQITGLGQAQRNANDGISVAQTTEGALNQVNDNLQRVRELTVQAANGTNSQDDLNSIQDEIDQRLAEIDRISEETSFNGVNVLAKDQEMSIQVGSEDGQTITMNLQEVNAGTLGLSDFNVNKFEVTDAATGPEVTAATGETFTVDGTEYTVSASGTTGAASTDIASGSIAITSDLSGTALESGSTSGLFTDTDGNVYIKGTDAEGNTGFYEAELKVESAGDATNPPVLSYTVGAEATGATDDATQVATKSPLEALDTAIGQIDSQRSELGAMQNRFDSAITNLSTTETNLSSARSRIEDADYATEVASMTKNQILQQAGTSVLAQANQLPQSALSLLG
ncbi:flagellin [Chromohalobacter marismortui]|uniref:Flagellin n=1 Tax=Chromohalobacter marismortui TaxID=42055 RepID=A0A4R7NPI8_9GAMM|nr:MULTISPECIES: FliC/FljB family flagellin [Chromohalobacter]MCI0508833.1 FliC/FljB family flagellin [Chromohalobacter sp.]MCI0594310.1 FliC/FljB family flagellin [Chromohalobacter sp.]TDU22793.1 flagellin [Chromohalobacter marismortui]